MADGLDVTQALKDAENSLRDFIGGTLHGQYGSDWIQHLGVTDERLAAWQQRKETEEKRQRSGTVEERLLYYADFYDLPTILKKNWSGPFAECFGEWKAMEVWLSELSRLRDPDAHRRELLTHQKHLILGISGEIRNRIIRYRSKQETADGLYPRIECLRDNLGNIWTPNPRGDSVLKTRWTETILVPGDELEFIVTASDPYDGPLEYSLNVNLGTVVDWTTGNVISLPIKKEHVRESLEIVARIRSNREYHAQGNYDDMAIFYYRVRPPKE